MENKKRDKDKQTDWPMDERRNGRIHQNRLNGKTNIKQSLIQPLKTAQRPTANRQIQWPTFLIIGIGNSFGH